MISKLAKNIAHFFVIQNITEESKEAIYAYGMELLISDVLNTIIVLLIALISHTLPAVVIFIAVFMGLRQFVGGYHATVVGSLSVLKQLFCSERHKDSDTTCVHLTANRNLVIAQRKCGNERLLLPVIVDALVRKYTGAPRTRPIPKHITCLFVNPMMNFSLMSFKSFGIGT